MGRRNPFRFAVNRNNGDIYLGDYSPDAGASNLSAVFVASYTDPGEGGTPGLTGSAQVRIVPSAGPTPTPTPPAP